MRTQPLGAIIVVFSSAVLTFGQSTTPTGVQRIGVVGLLRSESKQPAVGSAPPVEITVENATGAFVSTDYTNYTPPATAPVTTIGPCIVTTTTLPQAPVQYTPPTTTSLDAGPVINLNGPNGTMQIPQTMGFYYLQVGGGTPLPFLIPGLPGVLPLYLGPGSYEVDNGAGGADIGPFTTTMNIPSPGFVWTNADSDLTVTLAAGVDIQWSGGDPTTTVQIQGVATSPTMAGSFTCAVPNNGEFLVTSDVLAALPATPPGMAPGNSLTVSNSSLTNFSAPGIDMGLFSYEAGDTRTVVYQ